MSAAPPPRRVLDAALARRAALRAALCAAIFAAAALAFAFVATPGIARERGPWNAAIGACVGLLAAPLAWVERRWEPASAGRQGAVLLGIALPFVALAALAFDPFTPIVAYAKQLLASGSFERALEAGRSRLQLELSHWTLAPWVAPLRFAVGSGHTNVLIAPLLLTLLGRWRGWALPKQLAVATIGATAASLAAVVLPLVWLGPHLRELQVTFGAEVDLALGPTGDAVRLQFGRESLNGLACALAAGGLVPVAYALVDRLEERRRPRPRFEVRGVAG